MRSGRPTDGQRSQPYRRQAYHRRESEAFPHRLVGGEPVEEDSTEREPSP